MSGENYSVLMSVYFREQPNNLRQAMESMRRQTIPPDDFVLVCDGPLTDSRVIFSLQTIGFNNELLYRNRTSRSGSITATLNIKRLFDKLKIIDLLDQYFNESDWNRNIIESINDRKAKLCFGVISDLYFYKNDNRYSERR